MPLCSLTRDTLVAVVRGQILIRQGGTFMGRVILVLVALLMVGLWVNSVVTDRPATSRARAATPTVTRVSTPVPAPASAPETTATAAATPLASPTPSGPETIYETYIVQRGDTLNRIAALFSKDAGHNVTVADIVAANGIPNPARIGVGQQFTIPVVVTDGTAPPCLPLRQRAGLPLFLPPGWTRAIRGYRRPSRRVV